MPPAAAVDLHCHVLPAVDDGPSDLDDAVGMARQAEADGIAAICATPHIRHDHDVRIAELPARLTELSAAVRHAGCTTAILAGGEVAASSLPGLDDDELAMVTLGGAGRWVLLEPPPGPIDARLRRAVEATHGRGFRALIAHPERHPAQDLVDQLRRLVESGALVQATAAFLSDARTKQGMIALARAGLIHVLGSDAHSSRAGRGVKLAPALEVLAGVDPPSRHLDWIARVAPEAIVRGQDLTPPF